MGAKSSSGLINKKLYMKERNKARKKIILKFISDPENRDILENIVDLKSLIINQLELSATAQREAAFQFDCSATCLEAAELELLRLYNVYQIGFLAKSAAARKDGFFACPYSHICTSFDTCPDTYPAGTVPVCKICDRKCVKGGYHCSYCEYDVCDICCYIYCAEGHEMELWTIPDGTHMCSICKTQPITTGYHCTECNIDICDLCTYKPGRAAVQAKQIEEVEELIEYLEQFTEEAWTSNKVVTHHYHPDTKETYMLSTKTLHEYVVHLRDTKVTTQLEVKQKRIFREVNELRAIIAKDDNAIAKREMKEKGNFTELEITRLKRVIQVGLRAKSVFGRKRYFVGCPVGHYAAPFKGIPPTWEHMDYCPSCAICNRFADAGSHCPVCEYTMCETCQVIYDTKGHQMTMWTFDEPVIGVTCFVCGDKDMLTGYRCDICNVDMCDRCTNKEGREKVRAVPMADLMELRALVRKYKDKSDMAYSYFWSEKSYIISIKLLCDYNDELRAAMKIAERQDFFYLYILKMKNLRRKICVNVTMCATAARELANVPAHDYTTHKDVKRELDRLKSILDVNRHLKSVSCREKTCVACPLAHGMSPFQDAPPTPDLTNNSFLIAKEADNKMLDIVHNVATAELENSINAGNEGDAVVDGSRVNTNNDMSAMSNMSDGSVKLQSSKVKISTKDSNDVISALTGNDRTLIRSNTDVTGTESRVINISTKSGGLNEDKSLVAEVDDKSSLTTANPVISKAVVPCVVCARDAVRGYHCAYCDYTICQTCSTLYCRQGHVIQMWTHPEAVERGCDVCYQQNITSGYYCKICQVDICDRCTTKDARNVMLLLPKRELLGIVNFANDHKTLSVTARELSIDYTKEKVSDIMSSMSVLCSDLRRLKLLKVSMEEEIAQSKAMVAHRQYGYSANDL